MSESKKQEKIITADRNMQDENWEMRYMINKFGVTQPDVLEAIKEVGKNKQKVEDYLRSKHR
jgi:hypothetical protein